MGRRGRSGKPIIPPFHTTYERWDVLTGRQPTKASSWKFMCCAQFWIRFATMKNILLIHTWIPHEFSWFSWLIGSRRSIGISLPERMECQQFFRVRMSSVFENKRKPTFNSWRYCQTFQVFFSTHKCEIFVAFENSINSWVGQTAWFYGARSLPE